MNLRETLDTLQAMKDELKRCCMIYQYDLKRGAAEAMNAPLSTVDIPYDQWKIIRTKFLAAQNKTFDTIGKAGWKGRFCDYPDYLKLLRQFMAN
jgi:hypothetical protein